MPAIVDIESYRGMIRWMKLPQCPQLHRQALTRPFHPPAWNNQVFYLSERVDLNLCQGQILTCIGLCCQINLPTVTLRTLPIPRRPEKNFRSMPARGLLTGKSMVS